MIAQALDNAGGVDYLTEIAQSHPGPFLALVGKVLPVQLTGENGGPIQIGRIELVALSADGADSPTA